VKHSGTILLFLFVFASAVKGQKDDFMFIFRHPVAGSYYVNAMQSKGQYYLPMGELFSLLGIHVEKGESAHSFIGAFPGNVQYEILPKHRTIVRGRESHRLEQSDFCIGDMDLFLLPDVFEAHFGLQFSINLNTMVISLHSDHPLPAEERQQRERARRGLQKQEPYGLDFPLIYPRNRRALGAGVVDYALAVSGNEQQQRFNYTVAGGIEFLGGDLQGNIFGNYGGKDFRNITSDVNWRYVIDDNLFLTTLQAGNINTTGLLRHRITGVAVSNEPIMPRRIYDNYIVDGTTTPESEVELYVNNRLYAYTKADELGYYRFDYLLSYGTVRLSTRIYKPSGQIIVRENQLQIPYTFLPKGTLAYNIQGGKTDNELTADNQQGEYTMHGGIAIGISNALTARAGAEYFSGGSEPYYYTGLSARLFRHYLLNVDVVPGYFYRTRASVYFASSRSMNASFTHFDGYSFYNVRGAGREASLNINMPFPIGSLQSGFRIGAEHLLFSNGSTTRGRVDFNIRINRLNLRMNYRERFLRSKENTGSYGDGLATVAATYGFMRTPVIPAVLRGISVRAQAEYNSQSRQVRNISLHLSRSIARRGRLQISARHSLRPGAVSIQATINIDLRPVRASTQYTGYPGGHNTFYQSFSGSLLFDAQPAKIMTSNRRQVGQSAVSVMAFVDANGNTRYDIGEYIVPLRNIQLDQGAITIAEKDSLLRLTQLQPYWRYNAKLVHGSIPNPLLVPLYTEFSFVTDPNRFKRIEIPLYRAGIIKGMVYLVNDEGEVGIGGLRLHLKGSEGESVTTLRTFSDGSFYAMGVLPGTYSIEIDPVHLGFLEQCSSPQTRVFEIRALAEGDFVDKLDFYLTKQPLEREIVNPGVSAVKKGLINKKPAE
jgi:hypothetical protein